MGNSAVLPLLFPPYFFSVCVGNASVGVFLVHVHMTRLARYLNQFPEIKRGIPEYSSPTHIWTKKCNYFYKKKFGKVSVSIFEKRFTPFPKKINRFGTEEKGDNLWML